MIDCYYNKAKNILLMSIKIQTNVGNYWKTFFWKESSPKIYGFLDMSLKKNSDIQFYQNNGGTILAIGGKNFSLIASDTRFLLGMAIPFRKTNRIVKISPNILLATSGMFVDLFFLQNLMQKGVKNFRTENSTICLISSCAFYLSYILYCRRFFPFYTFNLLSGLEINREGCVFSYDAIGSFEKNYMSCVGSAQAQIQPILDGIFQKKSLDQYSDIFSIIHIKKLIKHIFLKISNRNINVGDGLQIFVVSKKGIFLENNLLKLT